MPLTTDEQRLIDSFRGPIAPVPTSVTYRAAIIAVALIMIALPLIYVAMIAGAMWLVWWHATVGIHQVHQMHGKPSVGTFILLGIAPLVLGSLIVVFMLKPLFARRTKSVDEVAVDPAAEPVLVAFVDRLCRSVGAPTPRRIDLECRVNASASFRSGMWSFWRNDLVLTIGMPLVANQNLAQFTGVLAHEFGHFAQGAGMRASYIIRTINHWFARVVYERDSWDERLVNWGNVLGQFHLALSIVVWLAHGLVWLTRRVLWVLMMFGHLLSTWLSRQMEFDADRHAARVVGAEAFGSALKELPVIATAEQGAFADLHSAWREKRLADDLPALIRANVQQIDGATKGKIIDNGLTEKAGMYATHPATRDRLDQGLRDATVEPIFSAAGPATQLFRDFQKLSQAVTMHWYQHGARLKVDHAMVVPTTELVSDVEQRMRSAKAWSRFGQGLRVFTLLHGGRDEADSTVEVQALRQRILTSREAVIAAQHACDACDQRLSELAEAQGLIAAKVRINTSSYKLSKADAAHVQNAIEEQLALRDQARAVCASSVSALYARLAMIPSSPEADTLRQALHALAVRHHHAVEVLEGFRKIQCLLAHIEQCKDNERFSRAILALCERQLRMLKAMHGALHEVSYPFPHAAGTVMVSAYAMQNIPRKGDDVNGVMSCSQQAIQAVMELAHRSAARLAELAEDHERQLGFEPLTEPPADAAS